MLLALRYKVEKRNRNSDEKNGENPSVIQFLYMIYALEAKNFKQKRKRFIFVKRKEKYDTERF